MFDPVPKVDFLARLEFGKAIPSCAGAINHPVDCSTNCAAKPRDTIAAPKPAGNSF